MTRRTARRVVAFAVIGFIVERLYRVSQRRYPLGNTEMPKGDQ